MDIFHGSTPFVSLVNGAADSQASWFDAWQHLSRYQIQLPLGT
jgi:hypothetical protein